MMDVLHLNIKLNLDEDLSSSAYQIAKYVRKDWRWEDVRFRTFTEGLSNNLIGVYQKSNHEDMVLVRIYGESSELFVDRQNELQTFNLLHNYGYAPKLYLTFENGMAFEYLPGVILNNELCQNPNVYPLVAQMMAKIHKIRVSFDDENDVTREPLIWTLIEHCIDLIPENFSDPEKDLRFRGYILEGKTGLKMELSKLKNALESVGNPVVFCHNDVLFANVIYNEKNNKVTFIDYEYAGFNYQAFDIASHFAAFADEGGYENPQYPSEGYQLEWIREYLKEFENCDVVDEDHVRLLYESVCKFMTSAHLFFAVWNFMQAELSLIDFDYMKFGIEKYEEYRKFSHYIS